MHPNSGKKSAPEASSRGQDFPFGANAPGEKSQLAKDAEAAIAESKSIHNDKDHADQMERANKALESPTAARERDAKNYIDSVRKAHVAAGDAEEGLKAGDEDKLRAARETLKARADRIEQSAASPADKLKARGEHLDAAETLTQHRAAMADVSKRAANHEYSRLTGLAQRAQEGAKLARLNEDHRTAGILENSIPQIKLQANRAVSAAKNFGNDVGKRIESDANTRAQHEAKVQALAASNASRAVAPTATAPTVARPSVAATQATARPSPAASAAPARTSPAAPSAKPQRGTLTAGREVTAERASPADRAASLRDRIESGELRGRKAVLASLKAKKLERLARRRGDE